MKVILLMIIYEKKPMTAKAGQVKQVLSQHWPLDKQFFGSTAVQNVAHTTFTRYRCEEKRVLSYYITREPVERERSFPNIQHDKRCHIPNRMHRNDVSKNLANLNCVCSPKIITQMFTSVIPLYLPNIFYNQNDQFYNFIKST